MRKSIDRQLVESERMDRERRNKNVALQLTAQLRRVILVIGENHPATLKINEAIELLGTNSCMGN